MNTNDEISIDYLIRNLLALFPLLSKSFKEIRSQSDLNPGSLFVLGMVERHQTLTMSEIGCKLSMPKPHVTSHIDKLVELNLVQRSYSDNDRRIINITLTPEGKEKIHSAVAMVSQNLKSRIETLDEEKLKKLYQSSIEVRNILSELMEDIH